MPGTDRRNSTSSEDASLPPSRQVLQDGTEFIPTRTAKSGAPKPAANPLQFIKVGPCDLYKAAQEQLKKVEEIKKVEKTVKTESEDWQSNLDNWKCSRRKRQEHIIDRVVEVKKLELEEQERSRRRGKTLSEMMEERTQKGIGPRKMSLMTYPDDDTNDFTDLGLSVDKGNGNDESGDHKKNVQNGNSEDDGNYLELDKKNGTNGHSPSSTETEEYTYERAIQGYKSFAEKSAKAATRPRGAETSESGIDMEESSLYTDENIDEVLGADDEDDDDEYPNRREEADDQMNEEHDHLVDLNIPRQIDLERHQDDSGFAEVDKNLNRLEDEIHSSFSLQEKESLCEVNEAEMRQQQEAVTRFDELIGFGKEESVSKLAESSEEVVEMPVEASKEDINEDKGLEEVSKVVEEIAPPASLALQPKESPVALYENIIVANQKSLFVELPLALPM